MVDRASTVVVIDDDPLVLRTVRRFLTSAGLDSQCFPSAREFLNEAVLDGPACLILDAFLPDISGLELQRTLAERGQRIPIVFISGQRDLPCVVRAMKAGATEFLAKPFRKEELLDAVRTALARAEDDLREQSRESALRARYEQLSPREREVFEHLIAGRVNKEVASKLGISEVTVKHHRASLRQKLQGASLPEMVRMAARLGLSPAQSPSRTPA